jgi:hypothetical protein
LATYSPCWSRNSRSASLTTRRFCPRSPSQRIPTIPCRFDCGREADARPPAERRSKRSFDTSEQSATFLKYSASTPLSDRRTEAQVNRPHPRSQARSRKPADDRGRDLMLDPSRMPPKHDANRSIIRIARSVAPSSSISASVVTNPASNAASTQRPSVTGPPSYVELLSCVEILRDARNIRNGDALESDDQPVSTRRVTQGRR